MAQQLNMRVAVLLVPAVVVGATAMFVSAAVDEGIVRAGLQSITVACAALMAWRVGMEMREKADVREVVSMRAPQLAAMASDRRRPTFDRDTGLCANWYFRLRVEEEIARAARYGEGFAMLSLSGGSREEMAAVRMALKQWLRRVDFAGDLGAKLAVVLPNTDRDGAAQVMDRLTKLVRGVELRVAQFPGDGQTLAQLLGDDEWRTTDPHAADAGAIAA